MPQRSERQVRLDCGIIVVGNEILHGYVQDANSGWISRRLTSLGFDIRRFFVVGDAVKDIVETLNLALNLRLNLIFVCGGLGGTPDDNLSKTNFSLKIDPVLQALVLQGNKFDLSSELRITV